MFLVFYTYIFFQLWLHWNNNFDYDTLINQDSVKHSTNLLTYRHQSTASCYYHSILSSTTSALKTELELHPQEPPTKENGRSDRSILPARTHYAQLVVMPIQKSSKKLIIIIVKQIKI